MKCKYRGNRKYFWNFAGNVLLHNYGEKNCLLMKLPIFVALLTFFFFNEISKRRN